MRLDCTIISKFTGKFALTAALGLGIGVWAISTVPIHAQTPNIVLQCVAPLVANADGTDCVRPTVKKANSCPSFLQPFEGRCVEPNHYIKFRNCSGSPRNFEIAIYPTDEGEDIYVLFVNGQRQSAFSDDVFALFSARAPGGAACRLN